MLPSAVLSCVFVAACLHLHVQIDLEDGDSVDCMVEQTGGCC
jgi:hypothetical protein